MVDFLFEAKEMLPQIIEWRRILHQNPETGNHLPKTAAFVEKVLAELGISSCRLTDSGVVAWLGEGERCCLLRADMDALPGYESSGLPFASANGLVHSCGHDIHTAMMLGTARLLKRREKDLHGRVVMMFQPGEECMTGALDMVEHGLLERFKPQVAFASHVNVNDVPDGHIWIKSGVFNAASDVFEVIISGKGGHGAHPQHAINPIYPMLDIIRAFTDISRYEVPALEPNILTVCAIQAGAAGNVIPTQCSFRGAMRTLDTTNRNMIIARLKESAECIAKAYRCTAQMKLLSSVPVADNTEEPRLWALERLKELIGEDRVGSPFMSSMGSEDFSQISSRVPSSYMSIGIHRAEGCTAPLHSENIVFDEKNIYLGTAAFSHLAYSYVNGTYLPIEKQCK